MLATWGCTTFPKPTLSLDFLGATSLDSGITFTRASNATYFNSAGVLTTAGSGVARFDYNPSTLQPRGLLIEEQRTNLLLQSQNFSTTWTTARVSINATAGTAPDGTNTANSLLQAAGQTTAGTISQSVTVTAVAHTISIYAKPNGKNWLAIRESLLDGSAKTTWFNVQAGTVGTTAAGHTASIVPINNGFYRCVITFTVNLGRTGVAQFFICDADNSISVADDGLGLFLWGAQTEVGAFATSYIPTTTTALTRNADVATMTGTNFSSWYNQTEGSLFAQGILEGGTSGTFPRQAAIVGSNANTDTIGVYWAASSGQMRGNITLGGVQQLDQGAGSNKTAGSSFKGAIAYKLNDGNFSSDGSVGSTDTSMALPTVQSLLIGGPTAFQPTASSWIQRISYYPVRLPNSTLQALTA